MINYKKELFQLLEQHLSANEKVDIEVVCTTMEKYMQEGILNENYKSLYTLFQNSNYSYLEFKFNLSKDLLLLQYKNAILERQNDWEATKMRNFQECLDIVRSQMQDDFKDLLEKQQTDLAFSIAENICELRMIKPIMDEQIAILNDKISLMSVTSQSIQQIDLICPTVKEKIASKTIINLLQNEFFEYIQSRHFQYKDKEELKKEIEQLKVQKKHLISLAIREVAKSLVSEGVLIKTSSSGNSDNLKNKNGEFISLSNEIAIKIYNIVKVLGFEPFFKGRKAIENQSNEEGYQMPDDNDEKRNYVKDRLKASATINIDFKSIFTDYQGYIL